MFLTLKHFLQLLNHFCGTCCGFFSTAVTSFAAFLLKNINSGAEHVVKNWPHLDYIRPKKPVPESAHIPFFVYRDDFTSF